MANREESVRLYDAVLERFPDVKRKGKASAYTSINGHMYSFVDSEGIMGLRFSKEDLEEFRELTGTGPFIQYDCVMRGYGVVPDDLLADTDALAIWFKKSLTYISSLKPKPTKKPAKK
jgi:hypothetical protein